jgi:hypothetical protein
VFSAKLYKQFLALVSRPYFEFFHSDYLPIHIT